MLTKIESAFRDLLAVLQTVKMYGTQHPAFKKSAQKAYASFEEAFVEKPQIVIGIIGEELAFEKEILFDLGKLLKPMIVYLKERNIERMSFSRGLTLEELEKFIGFIALKKEDFKANPEEQLMLLGIRNISVGKLKTTLVSEKDNLEFVERLSLYESSAKKVSVALDAVLAFEKIDHIALKFSLNNILENLVSGKSDILKLATVKRFDLETYVHMLNVSVCAMFFSSRLGFSKEDVLNIGVAALFHDVGKLYISRKVLHKKEKLTDQEFDRIKSHSSLGAELMLAYVDALGILPVVITYEHHLKYDLSGYPKGKFIKKLHIASSIVSLCDVYDALSQRRGYKQDYSPDVVYNIMLREKGSSFDPGLFEQFFKVMGVWPIGAIVALSDNSVAVVKEINTQDPFRPKIDVISPDEKKGEVDLLKVDSLKIERYLNPWKEGKDYLAKII